MDNGYYTMDDLKTETNAPPPDEVRDGNKESDERTGDILNVVDKLTEDVEVAVLQCAAGAISSAGIERVLKIGEDTKDEILVIFTAHRRRSF